MKQQTPPDNPVEQMKYVFHELHADGRHPLCAVCGDAFPGSAPVPDVG